MELIEDIPFGLAACFVNGEQVAVTALSDDRVRVRLDRPVEPKTVGFRFLRLREADWTALTPACWHVEACEGGRCGWELTLAVDDAAYRSEARRILNEYAAFVRAKLELGDDGAALELTGCPGGDAEARTLAEQKRRWFGGLSGFEAAGDWTLALSLDRPDAYERFMAMPFEAFQADFFRRSALDGHALFKRRAERVYIGNACCPELCPTDWRALSARCEDQGLALTAVLPPVRENRRVWLDGLLSRLHAGSACEIEVNDWGALKAASALKRPLLLGPQLNRRRKDPRLDLKFGMKRGRALLAENSLNDADFAARLREMGAARFEYEACGYPVTAAPGRHSLHLPFYLTNASHACPLASACEGADPGLPRDNRGCLKPCLSHALLYPERLNLTGRYNALFGLDRRILEDKSALEGWLAQGIDRLVAELL